MNNLPFLRIGSILINPAAIASIHDTDGEILITLLSIESNSYGSEADGFVRVSESELIQLSGDEAKAARSYFFSSMNTKKIA